MSVLVLLGPGFLAGECHEFTLTVDQDHVVGLFAAGILPRSNGVFKISFTAMEILRQDTYGELSAMAGQTRTRRVGYTIHACVMGVRHEVGVFADGEPELLGLTWLLRKAEEGERSYKQRDQVREEVSRGQRQPRGLLFHLVFAARAWLYEQENGR